MTQRRQFSVKLAGGHNLHFFAEEIQINHSADFMTDGRLGVIVYPEDFDLVSEYNRETGEFFTPFELTPEGKLERVWGYLQDRVKATLDCELVSDAQSYMDATSKIADVMTMMQAKRQTCA